MEFIKITSHKHALEEIPKIPDVVAIDTEYVKGNPRTTKLLSVIIANNDKAWIFDAELLSVFKECILSRSLIFLQDYNHCDTIILYKHGIDIRDLNCHNLIDMHHLLDENADHSLESRVLETFGDDYKTRLKGQFDNLEYMGKDGIYTYKLGIKDYETMECGPDTPELWGLYGHVRKLSRALLDTKLNGLKVNTALIQHEYDHFAPKIKAAEVKVRTELNEYCELWELEKWVKNIQKWESKLKRPPTDDQRLRIKRPVFNFNSNEQVAWLVYEALKCEVISKTKTGNPSTDFETLQTLAESEPTLRSLVELAELKSQFTNFIEGMLNRVEDNRIYPQFNVSGTSTGRISHSDPNMGNLPKTGTIRNFFVPDDGMVIIGADYSQLEVVIEANLTDDPQLLKIINVGASKHDITAQGLGIDRNSAKTLNFALQYGAGVGKVRKILGVTQSEAEDIYKRYWELYSGVSALKEKVSKEIQETGQITNLAGRTRHFSPPKNKYERYKQERQAYNFLIQGVAAECCNRAFYRTCEYFKDKPAQTLFSVHDEIVCQVEADKARAAKNSLVLFMNESSKDFNFKYPLTAKAYGPLDKWDKT